MFNAMRKAFHESKRTKLWRKKQELASPARYYGDGGTLHSGTSLDVEVHDGKVVSVWFRCQELPFKQHNVSETRSAEMQQAYAGSLPRLVGVEVLDLLNL